jgi:hypothetical protein
MFVQLGLPLEGRARAELAAEKLRGSFRINLARRSLKKGFMF